MNDLKLSKNSSLEALQDPDLMHMKNGKYSVFIADDDMAVLDAYTWVLSGFFSIKGTACNGKEAIDKYKEFKEKPDLILLDYRMPLLNGVEASKKILHINKDAKIVIISGDMGIRNWVLSTGMHFVAKPISTKPFLKKLLELLNNK